MPQPSSSPSQPLLMTIVVSVVTSAVVFVALSFSNILPWGSAVVRQLSGSAGQTSSALSVPQVTSSTLAASEDQTTIAVVKHAQPSVVAVLVNQPTQQLQPQDMSIPMDPFEQFFDGNGQQVPAPQSAPVPGSDNSGSDNGDGASANNGSNVPSTSQVAGGSGFFVSTDGIVVTNKHVVDFQDATFTVLTSDGKKYPATVLATDPVLDLAFLKVSGTGFPVLSFDDSDNLVAGQSVVAIGNALDQFRNTVTKGIVSGLNRRVDAGDDSGADEVIEGAIQTDAAINPGNSGGPLLDLNGNVVGINTAVSQDGQSLGFALPANLISHDAQSVEKTGKIVRPFLGVRYELIDDELVKANQLPVDHGALVVRGDQKDQLAVSPGSPADKAGIVENDIILTVNGTSIDEDHSLSSLIGNFAPGDKVTLTLLHAGKTKTVTVTLDTLKTDSTQ
ncbi:MAG: trypsin-like peptidase domain-containing protein [Patescibacteria group bacterium]